MKTFKYLLISLQLVLFIGCTQQNYQITKIKDYQTYLDLKENKALEFAETEKNFWHSKYLNSPNQVSYLSPMANAHNSLFDLSGKIEDLKQAEAYLQEANKKVNYQKAGLLRALAKNYITQHRFKEALDLLEKAFELGENKIATQKMLFDVYLELGQEKNAQKNLETFKNANDFDYLIRYAKWQDHLGNLDVAIDYMEMAKKRAIKLKNTELMIWSYSNLADFYGHAGRIDDSYQHFLKTLELNPNDSYALRGIAWIVFSHEKNVKEASRIINLIAAKHNTPDLKLFNAQLAIFENNDKLQQLYLEQYFNMIADKNYGDMYNAYSAALYAETKDKIALAFVLANKEIANRPTAQSYDLLAWAYYNNEQPDKALEIVEEHLVDKTFEPAIIFHMAQIYKANNLNKKSRALKKELVASLYELGPNMTLAVKTL